MGNLDINKMCLSKTKYETEEEVIEVIEYIEQEDGLRLKYYKCPVCGGYHLTSK